MPRPPKSRRICFQPPFTTFKPQGVPMHYLSSVRLTFDEWEALRLKDLEGLPQEEAARLMGVSQSTIQRILTTAHRKVADVLVRGKALQIEMGNVVTVENLMRQFRCMSCRHVWEVPFGTGQRGRDMACPSCGKATVHRSDLGPWRAEQSHLTSPSEGEPDGPAGNASENNPESR